jgi:hypothetical protein
MINLTQFSIIVKLVMLMVIHSYSEKKVAKYDGLTAIRLFEKSFHRIKI